MQASAWICTYQMQTTEFMSLLPLLVCSSCPRILILLNIAPLDPCPWSHSHLPLCHPRIIHIFVHFSPPLSSMTIKRPKPHEIGHVKINGYHLNTPCRQSYEALVVWYKELDLGRWLSLESSFLMDTFNLIKIDTTCNNMWKHEDLKCHM